LNNNAFIKCLYESFIICALNFQSFIYCENCVYLCFHIYLPTCTFQLNVGFNVAVRFPIEGLMAD